MVYRGHIRDGKVEFDAPVSLPDGTEVELSVVSNGVPHSAQSVDDLLRAIAADVPRSEWEKLPTDMSEQLDHYLYGTPRK